MSRANKSKWAKLHPEEYLAQQQRRADIMELRLKGYTNTQIAKELHVSNSVVSVEIKKIEDMYRASALVNMDVLKREASDTLMYLRNENIKAWERSQTDEETMVGTKSKKPGKKPKKGEEADVPDDVTETVTHTKRGRDGNPAFLMGAERALEKWMQLWGLIDVKKEEDKSIEQKPISLIIIGSQPSEGQMIDVKPNGEIVAANGRIVDPIADNEVIVVNPPGPKEEESEPIPPVDPVDEATLAQQQKEQEIVDMFANHARLRKEDHSLRKVVDTTEDADVREL